MTLPRRLLKPVESFHTVRGQDGTVLVEFASEILGVEVASFGFLYEPRCCNISLCHRGGVIFSDDPQLPDVIGQRRNICSILIGHCFSAFILEGYFAQANVLSLLDDSVLDRAKFFLFGEGWALTILLRIKIFDLALEFPPCLVAVIDRWESLHLIYDLIHGALYIFGEVAVFLFSLHRFQLGG